MEEKTKVTKKIVGEYNDRECKEHENEYELHSP